MYWCLCMCFGRTTHTHIYKTNTDTCFLRQFLVGFGQFCLYLLYGELIILCTYLSFALCTRIFHSRVLLISASRARPFFRPHIFGILIAAHLSLLPPSSLASYAHPVYVYEGISERRYKSDSKYLCNKFRETGTIIYKIFRLIQFFNRHLYFVFQCQFVYRT